MKLGVLLNKTHSIISIGVTACDISVCCVQCVSITLMFFCLSFASETKVVYDVLLYGQLKRR